MLFSYLLFVRMRECDETFEGVCNRLLSRERACVQVRLTYIFDCTNKSKLYYTSKNIYFSRDYRDFISRFLEVICEEFCRDRFGNIAQQYESSDDTCAMGIC